MRKNLLLAVNRFSHCLTVNIVTGLKLVFIPGAILSVGLKHGECEEFPLPSGMMFPHVSAHLFARITPAGLPIGQIIVKVTLNVNLISFRY